MKGKLIAIFAEQLYEEMELWYPYYRLQEEGAQVKIIGSGTAKEFRGKHGYPVTADASIATVTAEDFDAVIIPGGFAPDYMRRNKKMPALVRAMHEEGKVVAAICHGVWLLASADILKGKKATCFYSIRDDISNAGAAVVDKPVVRDRNIITSRKPEDLPLFYAAIIEALTDGKK